MSQQANPSNGVVAYTPSDDVADNILPPAGFYVGVAGDATLVFEDGSSVSHIGLLAGVLYPFRVVRVATGATAASLVAHYNHATRG